MEQIYNYKTEEIASRRRIAQNEFKKSIRFLKAMQIIYDKAIARYDSTKKTYMKLDLQYANLTKVTICPSRAKDPITTEKIVRKTSTKKIIENLDSLSIDQLNSLMEKLQNKEI